MSNPARDSFPVTSPGHVRIAYAGSYDRALNAEVTDLAHAVGAIHGYPTVRLRLSTRGFECAGSMMRWTEAFYAVQYYFDGATHGQRFSADAEGEAKARAYFAKLTDYEAVSRKRQEDAWLEETVYAPARAERAAEAAARALAEKERKSALRRHRAAVRRAGAAA